jgi:mannosyltransferase
MQNNAAVPVAKKNWDLWLCALFIGFGCLVTLLWWHGRESLWEDEIIAITHGNQPLPLFFVETLRNDIHPPLYFLQLKLWHDLGLSSDSAVLFNSVACAFFSLAILFSITRKIYGDRAACYATALFAVMPIFAYSGANLRMYGMVPGCVLLVWYTNRQWFMTRQRKWLIWAVVLEAATSYLHAIEFFFVGFIALGACLESLYHARTSSAARESQSGTGLMQWILAHCVVLLLILPLMASGVVRGSEATAPSSLFDLLTEPGSIISGWAPSSILPLRLAGLGIFLFLAAAAMFEGRTRVRTLVIVIATLTAAIAVSMLAKPMIKIPVFAANLVPFLALGAGTCVAIRGSRYWRFGMFACLAVLAIAALPLMRYQMTSDSYAETGRQLRQLAHPGDVVIVPNVSVFWGVMRYAVGEDWGKPLEIMPLQPNPQWDGVFRKLGPGLTQTLGLRPASDHVVANGITYVIGPDARHMTANVERVWVVQRDGYLVDAQLGARFARKSLLRDGADAGPDFGDLNLSLFIKDENGEAIARHPLAMN